MFRFIPLLYLFLIGCSESKFILEPVDEIENPQSEDLHQVFYFDSNPRLEVDDNGFYHLDFDDESIQTFTQLRAYVGYEYEYVGWTTDTAFDGCTWDYCEDVPIVNGSSYTTEDGYAYQMMGVYEGNIGDIATIWVGYRDNYGKQWFDSIRIMIDE